MRRAAASEGCEMQDGPAAAAVRLQQLNRLDGLKKDLNDATAKADGMRQAHEMLTTRLAELARAADMAQASTNRKHYTAPSV